MTDAERKAYLDAVRDRLIAAFEFEFRGAIEDARSGKINMEVFLSAFSAAGCTGGQGIANILGMMDNLAKDRVEFRAAADEVAKRIHKNISVVLAAHKAKRGGGL